MNKDKDPFILWANIWNSWGGCKGYLQLICQADRHSKFFIWSVGADLFLEKQSDISSFQGYVLGFMTDAVMGAMLGITVGLLIEWRGPQNWLLKGLGVGL